MGGGLAPPFMKELPPATPWVSLGDTRAIKPRAMGESRWGKGSQDRLVPEPLPPALLLALGHIRWEPWSDYRGHPSQGSARGPQQPEGPRLPCPGPCASLPGPRLQSKTGLFTPASFRKNRAEVCGGGAAGGGVSGKVPGVWCGRWRPECGPGSRLPSPHS